jgi:hypothetical protein
MHYTYRMAIIIIMGKSSSNGKMREIQKPETETGN